MTLRAILVGLVGMAVCVATLSAQQSHTAARIDSYIRPYVQTHNFSGAVLVEKSGKVIFQRAYGFADRKQKIRNTSATRFHIASISMQFTAAAIMRLVDKGTLSLDTSVGQFLPAVAGADKIKIRDLLTERSGLADINDRPDYNDILQSHQTPASLIAKIEGQSLLFEPGTKFLHEEHSAYNLLAFIVEKKTGLPFAAAVQHLVFQPMGLSESFVDDDSSVATGKTATGYQPTGVKGLERAAAIHWSAKTGNASVCTTVGDEARWVRALFNGHALSTSSRNAVLDTSQRVGYGWFKGPSKRLAEAAYYMNGRAPGFASFVLYLPRNAVTVVVFSNIYSSATTTIGYDIASIVLGLPHESFQPGKPLSTGTIHATTGVFQFGPDFYQKNAKVELFANEAAGVSLRWPSGDISALIPLAKDHFVDRSYWENVSIERDATGTPRVLMYGQFRGSIVNGK
jgi:D-alanyl-D-alanine carboxypeptidase